MADLKKYLTNPELIFEGFFRQVSSYSVFQNKTEFKVKVLTPPTPFTGSDPDILTGNEEQSTKFWFKGRITDPNMPHEKFLPDPCDESIASNESLAADIVSLHSTVYMDGPADFGIGSIITAFIEPGANNNKYDLQFMRYLKTDFKVAPDVKLAQECVSLANIDWSKYGMTPYSHEKYTIDDFTFESVPQPEAADLAIKYHEMIGGADPQITEYTEEGRNLIVDTLHAPAYEAFRGEPWAESEVQGYKANLIERAWSGQFLNACYIDPSGSGFQQFQQNALGFRTSGCCYPNAFGARNRREVFNNPQNYINQTILLIFSDEEIKSKPTELGLVYGDASIVGQEFPFKPWEEIRNEFENVGGVTHMNVYVGDKSTVSGKNFIGGNLGRNGHGTTAYVNDLNKHGFLKLVKIMSFSPNA